MKKILAFSIILILGATSAFAQLAFTVQGAMYGDKNQENPESVLERFKNAEGLFYGLGLELLMGKASVGLAGNASFYKQDLWGVGEYVPMFDYDLMLYGSFHLFGTKAFLDPFIEGGVGFMAQDYAVTEINGYIIDPDPGNPLIASSYIYTGAGLGINLGSLGAFLKASYNYPIGSPVMATTTVEGPDGSEYGASYPLAAYPISNLKVTLGMKIIF